MKRRNFIKSLGLIFGIGTIIPLSSLSENLPPQTKIPTLEKINKNSLIEQIQYDLEKISNNYIFEPVNNDTLKCIEKSFCDMLTKKYYYTKLIYSFNAIVCDYTTMLNDEIHFMVCFQIDRTIKRIVINGIIKCK